MNTEFLTITPVLPSADIARDVKWYQDNLDFKLIQNDDGYAILRRGNLSIHLQWHADTEEDPLIGGSVIRIFLKNIDPLFDELVKKGVLTQDKLRRNTAWKTNEFGLFDLNNNAIFFVEDV